MTRLAVAMKMIQPWALCQQPGRRRNENHVAGGATVQGLPWRHVLEGCYAEFTQKKQTIEDRLRAVKAALTDAERLNKALRVGCTPVTVVAVLRALSEARKTFERKESQLETAINAKGFEVDFLRRMPIGVDLRPFRFSDNEDDLWPIRAERAAVLTDTPIFEQLAVSATGEMTMMCTIPADVSNFWQL